MLLKGKHFADLKMIKVTHGYRYPCAMGTGTVAQLKEMVYTGKQQLEVRHTRTTLCVLTTDVGVL